MKKNTKKYYRELIDNIKNYIIKNPDGQHTLKTVARTFAISSSHLSRIFKNNEGETLKHFILTTRLGKALNDLVHTSNSVSDIAFSNGFNDYETFSRSFKRYFRVAPDDLRTILKQIFSENEFPDQRMIIIKTAASEHQLSTNECNINNESGTAVEKIEFRVKRKKIYTSKKKKFTIHKTNK